MTGHRTSTLRAIRFLGLACLSLTAAACAAGGIDLGGRPRDAGPVADSALPGSDAAASREDGGRVDAGCSTPCGPGTRCDPRLDHCVCDDVADGVCGALECVDDPDCATCTPSCTDLDCGDNGCGGVCGVCAGAAPCVAGRCEPPTPGRPDRRGHALVPAGVAGGEPALLGDDAGFVLVWSDQRDTYWNIYAQRFDRDGVRVGSTRALTSTRDASITPDIATDGERFLVTWREADRVYTRLLDSALDPLGSPVQVWEAGRVAATPRVVWNGSEYVVVWREVATPPDGSFPTSRRGRFVRLDSGGSAIGFPADLVDTGYQAPLDPLCIAATTSGIVVAWAEETGVVTQRRSAAGALIETLTRPAAAGYPGARHADVAASPTRVAVAWEESDGLRFVITDHSGREVVAPTRVDTGITQPRTPRVAWDGSRFVVAFADGSSATTDIYTISVDPSGVVGPLQRVTEDAGQSLSPVVASSGDALAMAWVDGTRRVPEIRFRVISAVPGEEEACAPGDARPCSLDGTGSCPLGMQACSLEGRWAACGGAALPPAAERCNGLDDDCNGTVDDVLPRSEPNLSVGPAYGVLDLDVAWSGSDVRLAWLDTRFGELRHARVAADSGTTELAALGRSGTATPLSSFEGVWRRDHWFLRADGQVGRVSADGTVAALATPTGTSLREGGPLAYDGLGVDVFWADETTSRLWLAELGFRGNDTTWSVGVPGAAVSDGDVVRVFTSQGRRLRSVHCIHAYRSPRFHGCLRDALDVPNAADVVPERISAVWTGNEYGVVWWTSWAGMSEAWFLRVDRRGRAIGAPVSIGEFAPSSLVWTGREYAVVRSDRTDRALLILDPEGAIVGEVSIDLPGGAQLVWMGDEFGAAWATGSGVTARVTFTHGPFGTCGVGR